MLRCTLYHRFYIENENENDSYIDSLGNEKQKAYEFKIKILKAHELKTGMKIMNYKMPDG